MTCSFPCFAAHPQPYASLTHIPHTVPGSRSAKTRSPSRRRNATKKRSADESANGRDRACECLIPCPLPPEIDRETTAASCTMQPVNAIPPQRAQPTRMYSCYRWFLVLFFSPPVLRCSSPISRDTPLQRLHFSCFSFDFSPFLNYLDATRYKDHRMTNVFFPFFFYTKRKRKTTPLVD